MRTFTKTLMAFAFIGFLMTSCGGGSEVCGCADTALAMMKEAKDTKMDMEKMKAIQEKYKEKMDKCEKILRPESEEARKKVEEEAKNCSSAKELEKIQKEMMGGE
jgi:hypothetical protein